MFDTCYLHIGGEKTGSTTIQKFLADNRAAFKKNGYFIPRAPGELSHVRLAVYAQQDFANAAFLTGVGITDASKLNARQEKIAARLKAEIEAVKAPMHALVLSSEHCQSEVVTEASVRRLADLLGCFARTIRIIFYVRRQDHVAVSHFSTALRLGFEVPSPDLGADEQSHRYNHFRVAKLYASVFGQDAIDVRLFGADEFEGKDLLDDFTSAIKLPVAGTWPRASRVNASLNLDAQRLLLFLNTLGNTPFSMDSDKRALLLEVLEREMGGTGILPARSDAEAFVKRFDASNEALRARYFPHLPTPLFGDDYSCYPTKVGAAVMKRAEAVQILGRLLPDHQAIIERL